MSFKLAVCFWNNLEMFRWLRECNYLYFRCKGTAHAGWEDIIHYSAKVARECGVDWVEEIVPLINTWDKYDKIV